MKKKDKIFAEAIKKLNKEHKPDDFRPAINKRWKKEWGSFVKYNQDWDGWYLMELIIYKLERMYIALDLYSDEYRPDLDKRLEVLKKTIDLGKKIQTFDYNQESAQFGKEHVNHYVYIYNSKGKTDLEALKTKELLAKVPQASYEELNIDDFLGDKFADQWLKEHGYSKNQVIYAYGGEWDVEDNLVIWKKMIKQEAKNAQKDADNFFKLIARNFRGWWY